MISTSEALERLQVGNQRFSSGKPNLRNRAFDAHARDLADAQSPFAVILGCSDSRVPVEMVFDQGLGDVFVIRVAGNILVPSIVGSVEFAVEKFGCSLVLVLGHTGCGAVAATVDQFDSQTEIESPNLHSIVERIQPVIEALRRADPNGDQETIAKRAIRFNVRTSTDGLRDTSPILARRIQADELLIVGAEYVLETGAVDFFYREAESP